MTAMTLSQANVGCLVVKTALGRDSKAFQKEVEKFLRHNGPEWTSSRMKAIWTAANHLRNGNPEAARGLYQENSIRYNSHSMVPKGPIGRVVKDYAEAERPSVIRRKAAVLRFYTTLTLPELSQKQSEKAYDSITSWFVLDDSDPKIRDLREYITRQGAMLKKLSDKNGFHIHRGQTPWDGIGLNTYKYHSVPLSREDKKTPLRDLAASLLTEAWMPEQLTDTDPFPLLRRRAASFAEGRPTIVGRIGVIQEQGCKARVMAMPSARVQYAMKPLQDYLSQVDSFMPTSVLTDQQRAIHGILKHREAGLPAYSTDLSSATDRFPRDLSFDLLRGLGLEEYVAAIESISQGNWKSPWGMVTYATGQPMGMYGSFPLFHLTNQLVAGWCQNQIQDRVDFPDPLGGKGNSFYVLGDDVVFSDSRVEETYRDIMGRLGVPISESKSFGGDLTEFAGFVVTESRGKPFAFKPYKPPSKSWVSNPIDFLAAMGTKANVINPRWERLVNQFQRTWADRSPDLTPLIKGEDDTPLSVVNPEVLDNEFNVIKTKYPESVPDLSPAISYQSGIVKSPVDSFTIVKREETATGEIKEINLSRNRSKDRPQVYHETNRRRLGEKPKHLMRVEIKNPYDDPLMKREKVRDLNSVPAPDPSSNEELGLLAEQHDVGSPKEPQSNRRSIRFDETPDSSGEDYSLVRERLRQAKRKLRNNPKWSGVSSEELRESLRRSAEL